MNNPETIDLEASDVDFPELHQGLLDTETLAQYFRDLENAQVYEVLVKGAAERYAEDGDFDLERGRDLFLSGAVLGLQIRYRWNGDDWWDTLMQGAGGVRIIRVQHQWDDQ